ncbi:MAG: hypothetical protein FJX54_20550 [Alphaproteobacteria bacterium]|nr:hypothetical protein [Alphaproteobacteria bacterium]
MTAMADMRIRQAVVEDAAASTLLRYRLRAEKGHAVESEEAFIARTTPWIAERLERACDTGVNHAKKKLRGAPPRP